jgi:hypothetical protein
VSFGLSPETIRGRLRDACSSLAFHQWKTKLVDLPSFNSIDQTQLTISIQPDGTVVAGNKQTIKEDVVDVIDAVAENEIFDCTDITPTTSTDITIQYAHAGLFKKHLRIKLTQTEYFHYLATYDIMLTQTDTPDTYILS